MPWGRVSCKSKLVLFLAPFSFSGRTKIGFFSIFGLKGHELRGGWLGWKMADAGWGEYGGDESQFIRGDAGPGLEVDGGDGGGDLRWPYDGRARR